jgi:hypothetical protein
MDGVGEDNSKKPTKRVGVKRKTSSPIQSSLGFIEDSIKRIEEKLRSQAIKASYNDYFKLLQLRDGLVKEELKEIKVTWVEPSEKEPATET